MAKLSPEIEALIKRYEEAQINLTNIIANQEARGNLTTYRKGILASVNQELKLLNQYAKQWVESEVPNAYKKGSQETYKAFREANIAVGEVAINSKVVNKLVDNAVGQLTDASSFVGRRIDDEIRQAGLDAIANKAVTGSTVKEAKANLISKLTDKGITAIRDKRGREIKLEAYAETVARTTTAETTNKSAMQSVQDLGYDLVQITQHFSSCPVCAVYEGRVYSISGKSKDYPPLDEAFRGGYSTIHPNCTHRAVPYFPQFDDNAEELKKTSNKPFTVDDRSKASIDAYNRQQAIKTARRDDRNEWQQAKLAAPNETPKTFSAFRSIKKADTRKYQEIKTKVNNFAPQPKTVEIPKKVEPIKIIETPKKVTKPEIKTAKTEPKKKPQLEPIQKEKTSAKTNSMSNAKNFKDIENQLADKYGIVFWDDVTDLDFKAVKESTVGITKVLDDFPESKKYVRSIKTVNGGVMTTSDTGVIGFDPIGYKNYDTLKKKMAPGPNVFHPLNTGVEEIGTHEMGHVLEKMLIDKSGRYEQEWEKKIAWSNCNESNRIVNEALKRSQTSKNWKFKTKEEAIQSISKYAKKDSSECMAEALADYYRNGDKAQILSQNIYKVLKEQLK